MVARGIMNIYPDRLFFANGTNFSHQDVCLQILQNAVVASEAPREIAIGRPDWNQQMEDLQRFQPDRRNIEDRLEKFEPYLNVSDEMLDKFESMWDGHLGRVNISKQPINLSSEEVPPILSAPCRAGQAARKFLAVEIDRMLEKEFIETTTTQWVSPIVFPPKKDRFLRFSLD